MGGGTVGLISDNFILVACARIFFSGNIYPIDLKFSEMVYYVKIKGWTKGISFNYFFSEKRSRALVQRMVKIMPKYEKCKKYVVNSRKKVQ